MSNAAITIAKSDRVSGIPTYTVSTPVGTFNRETIESARETAALQSKAHSLPVVEVL